MAPGSDNKNSPAFQATWAIALAADSPVLVVPWHDDSGCLAFVDLYRHPERITDIPETLHQPALTRALQQLNAPDSPWATAKCDRWLLDEEDLDAAALDLALARDTRFAHAGIGSYVDFYHRDTALFTSLQHHRELLIRLAQVAMQPPPAQHAPATALLELTLRRCIANGRDGFSITAFLYAIGQDAARAQANWSAALGALTQILHDEGDTLKPATGVVG
jgi:hypothetical protein